LVLLPGAEATTIHVASRDFIPTITGNTAVTVIVGEGENASEVVVTPMTPSDKSGPSTPSTPSTPETPVTDKGTQVISKIIKKDTNYVEGLLQDLEPQVVDNIKSALEILIKSLHRQDIIRPEGL
jgi:hypothetical protein